MLHFTGSLPFALEKAQPTSYHAAMASAMAHPSVVLLDYADTQQFLSNLPAMAEGVWIGLDLPGTALSQLKLSTHNAFRYDGSPKPVPGSTIEIALKNHPEAQGILHQLAHAGLIPQQVPDVVGMVSQRVIALIIAEAQLLVKEHVATPADIDISMRQGTSYPLGPGEWLNLWGKDRYLEICKGLMAESPTRYGYLGHLL